MKKEEHLAILHKYWIWSNMMRVKFFEQLANTQDIKSLQNYHVSEVGVYMMYWYSSLYAVVEGYKDFNMENIAIEKLLEDSEKIELLRRFRNAAFHVQKEYFSEKYIDFIVAQNSAEWVSNLSETFGQYFRNEMDKFKP